MNDKERDALCRRIDDLCAENEQLRQENQSIGMAAYELGRKSMADENAKLRELAKEACELARIFYDCGGTFNDLDDLLCEASELGIEVDS